MLIRSEAKIMSGNKLARRVVILAMGMLLTAWGWPLLAQDAAAIYKGKCSACHGPDGKGDTAMGKKLGVRDFSSPEVQKQSDNDLIAATAKGKNKMPAYEKSLKENEIKDLIAYIRQLGKRK
jgi:mono/diheme cytochrome c family protein